MRRQHIALRSPEQREWAAAIAPARISREKAVLENLSAVWHGGGWRRQHERVARGTDATVVHTFFHRPHVPLGGAD